MKTILYDPVCIDCKGNYFRVNGAIDKDKDKAINKAIKHTKDKHKIVRIEEIEIDENN